MWLSFDKMQRLLLKSWRVYGKHLPNRYHGRAKAGPPMNPDPKFKFPKPSALVKELVRIFANKDGDIVLDSTAGSGTTGDAVLQLSKEPGVSLRFILVQQKHDSKHFEEAGLNICQEITAERVRRVIEGYTYTKRGPKGKTSRAKEPGLGGTFTYARVGDPLFSEYRDFGDKPPSWEDLAKYIFYTETSRDIDLSKLKPETGFIGRTEARGGEAFYLLYTPNKKEDRELSTKTLDAILKKEKAKSVVVYCEKIWMHPEELRKAERDAGVRIRSMLVPFNLK